MRKPAIQQQLECDVEELLTLNDQLQVTSDEILFANEELRFLNQELLTRSDLMSSAMARLEVSEARYRSVVEDQSEYICRYRPDGTITFANVALCRALGLRLDQLTGRKFDTLWPHCGDLQARLAELSPEQPNQSLDLKIEVAGGHAAWQHWSDHAFFDSGGHVVEYQSVGEDVTDRIECERRYRYLAIHDQLTGLANRHGFFEHVNDVLAAARRTSQPVAVLYLDLDHFKDVNDGLGHAVGDALLRSVGERLSNEIRSNDFLARLGGDEFAVVQTAAHDIDDLVHLAKRLIAAVQTPHHVAETCLKTSATLGIALFPDDGVDAGSLLDRADLAMYESKKRGGGRFGFFTKGLDERVAKQFQMKSELSAAINQNQFRIHYQPIVDLGKDRICAIEALLRWQHPTHGLLNASAFIDVLETIPEISAVSLWTLELACQQAKTWVVEAGELIRLNVNLSGCMLREPALVASILAILDRTGFDPARLELEVTEHAVIEIGLNEAADRLRELSDLGIGIALDDFGTGYSSLTFLRALPVSHIKIDRSFVAGLNSSTEDQAIVNAVIDLGRSLSLDVTAEGVEDKEVSACLQQSGCNRAQGYLYGAAVPAASIAGLIGKTARGLQMST